MKQIVHVSDIAVPAQKVYNALTTSDGLSGWWTRRVSAETAVGGLIDFTFMEGFNPEMRVTALEPRALIAWECVGGHEPWAGSTFRFELTATDGGTRLIFRMEYARELDDVSYGIYNYNWGYYLESLRLLCETGAGTPHAT